MPPDKSFVGVLFFNFFIVVSGVSCITVRNEKQGAVLDSVHLWESENFLTLAPLTTVMC